DVGVPTAFRSGPLGAPQDPMLVQRVELVYLIPGLEIVAQDPSLDLAWRTAQPVWYFSGSIGEGLAFDGYVQAVEDTHLQSAK
ncbi:MAG: hypothetical protein WBA34_09685, partial [Candidatus Deferrimicrobiaceae bacterium]